MSLNRECLSDGLALVAATIRTHVRPCNRLSSDRREHMCVPRLLGRVDRFRAESRRVAFLSDLSLRLEDIDYRPTGLRHGNPLTDPYSRADRSASDRRLVDPKSWCRRIRLSRCSPCLFGAEMSQTSKAWSF